MDCPRHTNHMSVVSFYTQRHMQWSSELALALVLVLAFGTASVQQKLSKPPAQERGKANILQVDLKSL